MKALVPVFISCATLIVFFATPVGGQEESQVLVSGMNVEHTLGPGENHAYTIALQEGTAVIGEADQHGIDLVIDIFDADGKLIRTVDSPNETEGPEPIDLTAFKSGRFKLVIHAINDKVKPGKYVLKIDRILTVEENGLRLAEKIYPSALLGLWKLYQADPNSIQSFLASRQGKGPIVEPIEGDSKNLKVIYLYYGDENTLAVRTGGGPHAGVGGILMQRFMRTPLFFASEVVPADARFRYGFATIQMRFIGPTGSVQVSEDRFVTDSLNPEAFGGLSVLAMPGAPPPSYVVANDSVPKGILIETKLKSTALNEDRSLTVYLPPGYDESKASDLLIVFDGSTYGAGGDSLVPTPTILDNLIAAGKIGPTVALLVSNMGKRNRDLTDYPPFADFVGTELVSWVRTTYKIKPGPDHVVVAGSSFGGLGSSYCAFKHPEAIGNVLSQSGSYWVTGDWQKPSEPWPLSSDTGDLVAEFRKSKPLPIRFYIEIGRFDSAGSMLGTNREFRDVLLLKGYQVTYKEFDSGHDYIWWRNSLADGLIALIGKPSDPATKVTNRRASRP